jgi:hypothetical protein
MKRILVTCDGAPVPASLRSQQWDVPPVTLRHRGPKANLNLHVESPSHALLTGVQDRAADLLRMAAYIYAADQMVRRGGEADLYGDFWERDFTMCIPVNDPEFWSDKAASGALSRVLHFVSADRWSFMFSRAAPQERQLPFDVDPNTELGNPDSVYLFSGGTDSLCAVVEAVTKECRRPLLVAHSPAFHIASRQRALVQALNDRYRQEWQFPRISVAIHRTGSDPREYTQRTRFFLYATLGALIADRLELPTVALADNGVVSLNLPINDQLIGTMASRSAHPKSMRLFNEFVGLVLPSKPSLTNPLWSRTRTEALQILTKAGAETLLEKTNSCSHPRYLTAIRPHCGVCSQCVDRRFATLAAGLEEHDPGDRYDTDIFRDALPEGNPRTMVVSYVRFARDIAETPQDALFTRFPQLFECIAPNEPRQRETAEALTSLLQRHAATVLDVIEEQISQQRKELARQRLPANSLISLLASAGEVRPFPEFRASPDYRQVWLRGEKFTLTTNQARVVQLLYETQAQGTSALSQGFILEELEIESKRLSQVFRRSNAWGKLVVRAEGKGMYRLNV